MEQIARPTLKTLDAAEGRVGGYLVVWGSPQQRDLQGEYFTPHTDFGLDWYAQRPVLYHHGLDGHLKTEMFDDGYLSANPPRYTSDGATREPPTQTPPSPLEDDEILRERLRSLGYVE